MGWWENRGRGVERRGEERRGRGDEVLGYWGVWGGCRWGKGKGGGIHLLGLQTRGGELGGHASHVEIVEVDADVDLAGGDAVDTDAGACAFTGL